MVNNPEDFDVKFERRIRRIEHRLGKYRGWYLMAIWVAALLVVGSLDAPL